MTAEDDYPADGAIGGTAELAGGMYEKMCAEINQLRREVDDADDYIVELRTEITQTEVELRRVGRFMMRRTLDGNRTEWDLYREWTEPREPQ